MHVLVAKTGIKVLRQKSEVKVSQPVDSPPAENPLVVGGVR